MVGVGPGDPRELTSWARAAIAGSDLIIGLKPRIELVGGLIEGKEVKFTGISEDETGSLTGIEQEVTWAELAIQEARKGKTVALLSAGDAGIYGMAGLVFEVLQKSEEKIEVEVVPGITALNAAAARLGAPLMQDFAVVSLSDLLTPWEITAKRLEAAARSDFVIVLYNPRTQHERRCWQITKAQKILSKHRPPSTPVGLVNNIGREDEKKILTTLGRMLEHDIGLLTTIVIGNSSTFVYGDRLVTPRGYHGEYSNGKWSRYL
ncbi:Cobalt-factor III methyltransferase [subsurface metagenome]